MRIFEIVIALLLAGAGLSALARRIGVPYPALVALAGAVLAIVPGTPILLLDPSLALALFVAPVLLDAAFDSSPRDLRRNWRQVVGLSVGAVALTVAAVAAVAHLLVPDLGWAAAIALGAIVAPPDAAAATAVLKQLRPPYRLLVILEGESLFNDASALLIFRLAVDSATGGAALNWTVLTTILLATVGSVALGLIAGRVLFALLGRVRETSTAIILQFATTFGIWLLADRLHLSAILTMVVYAMTVSRSSAAITPARIRVPSYAVWEVMVFVLNVLAFILVGLQLKPIISGLDRSALGTYALVAAAVCGAAILARLVWVILVGAAGGWWCRHRKTAAADETNLAGLSMRESLLVGWCGMRGIVTLAAALALPAGPADDPGAFPHRDLILFVAFAVVLGTLVLQGVTLRPLLAKLRLAEDGTVEQEVRLARLETLGAGLQATSGPEQSETLQLVRRRYQLRLSRAQQDGEGSTISGHAPADDWAVARNAIAAERQRLIGLRAEGTIGDTAFQRIEQELDWREMELEQLL